MDISDLIYEISFEVRAEASGNNFNVNDLRSYAMLLEQKRKKGLKNSVLNRTPRCRCSAPPVELSGQLGAGHYDTGYMRSK